MRTILISEFETGREVRLCNGWVRVVRHGNMGTEVQPLDKVERTVTNHRTGVTKTFAVPQRSYLISAGSPVYETRTITVPS